MSQQLVVAVANGVQSDALPIAERLWYRFKNATEKNINHFLPSPDVFHEQPQQRERPVSNHLAN